MMCRKFTLSVTFLMSVLGGYSQNNLPDTANLFPNDMLDGQKVYTRAKPMPQFTGDVYQLLRDSLSYPPAAGKWRGTVYVSMVIDTNGNVRNAGIVKVGSAKYVPKAIETEMVGLMLRMGKWKPGIVNRKLVPVRVYLPGVTFEPPDGQ
jgi:hypothetical protein